MTSDFKLSEILQSWEPRFLGVFLYDQLDKLDVHRLRDRVLILNYITTKEASEGRVGHFVVLDFRFNLVKNNGWENAYYFDPYGLLPDEPRNIMGLPNKHFVSKILDKYYKLFHIPWKANTKDFQAWKKWDNLCGIYASLYVENPNFETNPIFSLDVDRADIDYKLKHIFEKLKVLGEPFQNINIKDTREVIRTLAKRHNVLNVWKFLSLF